MYTHKTLMTDLAQLKQVFAVVLDPLDTLLFCKTPLGQSWVLPQQRQTPANQLA